MAVDSGIGGQYVAQLLDEAAQCRGSPTAPLTGSGPEFITQAFLGWCERNMKRAFALGIGNTI
ncbi:hypothetical protein [Paracidovorax wautersii]|uniref:Transposase n=1 Tax=Paracidovorax wautersii TaxID=1177982 RepID=A0ABU1IBI5_9BURK|nr:hypothetical protein [Paracidovorax wautersii]MDR6214594.1 hypothetical protein [Paracidovorax wautersii]